MFSGLTPRMISLVSLSTTNGDHHMVAKFANTVTVINTYIAAQNALTTSTTNFAVFRLLNGGTTGNVTTRALFKGGSNGGAWAARTWRQITTHYTYTAGNSMVVRYSETGTVALGYWCVNAHVIEGNV